MSLRGKLKQKEGVEEENDKLRVELNEMRARAIEQDRKRVSMQEEVKLLQGQVSNLQRDNKGLKDEMSSKTMVGSKKKGIKAKK